MQIWFQNRRQVTRRKSQPLSLSNIDSTLFSSQDSLGTSAYSSFSVSDSSQPEPLSSQTSCANTQSAITAVKDCFLEPSQAEAPIKVAPEDMSRANREILAPPDEELDKESKNVEGSQDTRLVEGKAHGGLSLYYQFDSDVASLPNLGISASSKHRPRTLARSNTSPFSIYQDSSSVPPSTKDLGKVPSAGRVATSASNSTLRRASSLIRLSTSLEGKAKVAVGSSPSPTRIGTARPVGGLQRTQSAVELSKKPVAKVASPIIGAQKSAMPGRSRDARTWEFYCDSSARDALTEQAEREQSGSAAGVIGLLRSRSNKVLASNPNKRNARPQNHESIKRLKADDKRAHTRKLSRTQSSVGRLQSVNSDMYKQPLNRGEKSPKSGSHLAVDDPGDSDKENWEPGTQSRAQDRRPNANQTSSSRMDRSILKESLRVPSQSSSLDALMAREKILQREISETSCMISSTQKGADEYVEEEIKGFMNGSGLPREPDDLDCVQNLLSLSQGKWR